MPLDECKTQLAKTQGEIEAAKKAEQLCQAKLTERAIPAAETETSAAAGVSAALLPFASASTMPITGVLRLLLLSGLMGMLGQGARTIVGLKKLSDLSNTAPSQADEFTAARIFIGLMIGFIAGVIGGLTPKVWDAHAISGDILFYLASIGYIGVDVIEGFAQTLAGGRKPSAAPGEAEGGEEEGGDEGKKPPPDHRKEPSGPQGPAHPGQKPVEVFSRKAPAIMANLKDDFALKDHHAAAILGNLGAECNGFTQLQEVWPLVAGSRGGYGWAQWTGPRRKQFEAFCEERELPKNSDQANYGFLKEELQGSHKRALEELKAEQTLAGAVEAFMESYEGPAVPNPGPRTRWAQRALDAYHAAAAYAASA